MEQDTRTFLKVLDPEDTSTGGGSASAIAGAMAGALIAMACLLSSDAPNHTAEDSFSAIARRAQLVSNQLLAGSEADSHAFQAVRRAYRLPLGSEAERKIRNEAAQAAWLEAIQIPLANAVRCLQMVKLGYDLSGRINPRVRSDLNCAVLLARTGVLGCLENVATNLPSMKDTRIASHLARQADSLREQLAAVNQPANDRPSDQPISA